MSTATQTTSASAHRKVRIVFVAGLTLPADGSVGGQITAATMLANSDLSRQFDIVKLSSSMASVPLPPLHARLGAALGRLLAFRRAIDDADVALIFAADGLSVIEKGAMAMFAHARGRGVVLRLSSGGLKDQSARFRLFRWWLGLVLRQADVVCAQGPTWKRFFEAFPGCEGRVAIIPNGVVLPARTQRSPRPLQRLIMVTQVARTKGIFDAIDAMGRLVAANPKLVLTIVGGGPDLERLREHVRRVGLESNVELLGWQPRARVDELLGDSDAFLLPSHFEGLPNAMLEAMTHGVPVVVTPVGAIPDIVRDGHNGLLVDVGDVAGLVRAVELLISDPRRGVALGMEGRRTVEEAYDIERIWRLYAGAIERAALQAGRLPTSA